MTVVKAGAPLAAAAIRTAAGTYTPVLTAVAIVCLIAGAGITATLGPRPELLSSLASPRACSRCRTSPSEFTRTKWCHRPLSAWAHSKLRRS